MRNDKYLSKIDPATIAKGVTFVSGVASPLIGQQQQQAWSAPDCGKRPFFIGARRNDWEKCRAQEEQRQSSGFQTTTGTTPTGEENFFQKNKNILVPAAIAAGALIAYSLFKKR